MDSPMSSSPSGAGMGGGGGGSSGMLRTKISLARGNPSLVLPFYLMKPELPASSSITGRTNLLAHYGLDTAFSKFCGPKKLREELSAFLTNLPGTHLIDNPSQSDVSSLRNLIERPPIVGKEVMPLSGTALAGFTLRPGPIPDSYRDDSATEADDEKKKYKKKHKRFLQEEGDIDESESEKKIKKPKKEEEKEKRKKKKKEKRKKQKQSPSQ